MQTVHVRIHDAVTEKPTACRIRFTDSAGKYYAPLGRLADFPAHIGAFAEGNVFDGNEAWSYVDGSFEIPLPPGAITVEIHKGFEYVPFKTTIQLAAGKLSLRFVAECWTDGPADGWFSGDSRVHLASPHELLLEAAAEDLALVNLLAQEMSVPSWHDPVLKAIPNIIAFSGQTPCLEMPGHMVVVNTHNVASELGSLGLLNCHRVVYPLSIAKGDVSWTLADWCNQCHRKAGLVVWTDACKGHSRFATEGLANLILGRIDAFEIDRDDLARFTDLIQDGLYTLWNAGFRVPLVGGSGRLSNAYLVGRPRTYCRLPPGEAMTYPNWIEAVRAGRTYVTRGPLLSFRVNGIGPGELGVTSVERRSVTVQIEARSQIAFETLELVLNGTVVATARADQSVFPCTAAISQEVSVPDGGWLATRCWGTNSHLLAHSSPVNMVEAGPVSSHEKALDSLAAHLTEFTLWAEKQPSQNFRLLQVLESARDNLAGQRASRR